MCKSTNNGTLRQGLRSIKCSSYNLRSITKHSKALKHNVSFENRDDSIITSRPLREKRSFEDSDDGVEEEEEGMFEPSVSPSSIVLSGWTYYRPAFCLRPCGHGTELGAAGARMLVELSNGRSMYSIDACN